MLVKRVKKHLRNDKAPERTHWAVEIAPAGNVVTWSEDKGKALEIDGDTASKVVAFYAGRKNAGEVTAEPSKSPAPAPAPKVDPKPVKSEPAKGFNGGPR